MQNSKMMNQFQDPGPDIHKEALLTRLHIHINLILRIFREKEN